MTSPAMILDFFPENALGDGPKNSRIRVKSTLDVTKKRPNEIERRQKMVKLSKKIRMKVSKIIKIRIREGITEGIIKEEKMKKIENISKN